MFRDDVKWERWKRHQNMIHWCGNWRRKILVTKWSNWKFMCINKWNILVDQCRALSNLKCKVFITLFHQHQHYYQYSLRGGESSEESTHYNIKLNKKRDTSSSWERYFLVSDPGEEFTMWMLWSSQEECIVKIHKACLFPKANSTLVTLGHAQVTLYFAHFIRRCGLDHFHLSEDLLFAEGLL